MKGAQKVELKNGLTVLLKEDHYQPVVSVQVWVKVGAVNEIDKTDGLSHFLEHLIFKGTEKYTGNQVSHLIETQGGVINAATSKEFTNFYIDMQKSGVDDAIKILGDTMFNAVFPKDEMEKERLVVLEEINRHFDNPSSILYDSFSETVFKETPYRRNVIGSAEVVGHVTREEVLEYYHAHYVPRNMVLSVAGDFDTQRVLALIEDTFGKAQDKPEPAQPLLVEKFHKPALQRQTKQIEHAYWMAGFLGPDILSKDQFAGDIAANVLGGGRSSRLYQSLRENKKLVYMIDCGFQSQRGSGVLVFSSVFDRKNEKETVECIQKEIGNLRADGPTEEELKRSKEMARSQWYFSRETVHDQASNLGYWYMQKNPDMIDNYVKNLEKVTREDVKKFLKDYFDPQGLNQSIIVPERDGHN
jgi:zinc protease